MPHRPDHYDYAIDPQGDSTPNKVLRWVGQNKKVLELGTAAGVMTRALRAQGCTVTGIEYVPAMAERAAPYCERMIVGDIETLDLNETLGEERFDVIVAADVLEHLRDPWHTLERLRGFLKPEGYAVLSIPNIGHAAIIAALLGGRFDYRDKGLLDRTHLRFFTRTSIEDMLLATGWVPLAWQAQRTPPLNSEFAGSWLELPDPLKAATQHHPDSDVYQFIVKVVPATERGWQESLRHRMHELENHLQDTERRFAELQARYDTTLADLREHQKAFGEAREWIAQLQQEQQELHHQLAERDARLAQTQHAQILLDQLGLPLDQMATPSRSARTRALLHAILHLWRKKP
ncbi:MAG: class I SAM-dependent methyltransferase [Pseudomonadota bacterium]|jgi:2-polyprenyl-3-methyl-5-hydroxy-6-metoxy-1,4-benzoquinol methylase